LLAIAVSLASTSVLKDASVADVAEEYVLKSTLSSL
jgi:hypothetical protein